MIDPFDYAALHIDQAYVNLTSTALLTSLFFYTVSDNCHRCPFQRWHELTPAVRLPAGPNEQPTYRPEVTATVDTAYGQRWRVFDADQGAMVPSFDDGKRAFAAFDHPNVGAFGVYRVQCDDNGCEFSELSPPVNTNLDMVYFVLVVAVYSCIVRVMKALLNLYQRIVRKEQAAPAVEEHHPEEPPTQTKPPPSSSSRRLRSLDTMRGLIIALMIVVSSGAGGYWWLRHADWNGLHVGDAVMPCFLWMMGACIPMTVRAQLAVAMPRSRIIRRMLARSVQLFLIGVLLNIICSKFTSSTLRLPGVPQRLGIAYAAVGTLYVLLARTIQVEDVVLPLRTTANRWRRALYDLECVWPLWLIMFGLVAVHWSVIFHWVPFGCQPGYMGPGGWHENGQHANCTGGAAGSIDRQLLPPPFRYQATAIRVVYGAQQVLDPMGAFGLLLVIVQCAVGMQAGVMLLVHQPAAARLRRFAVWASVLGVSGAALAGFSRNDGLIPVNMVLWSLSYVLVTSGVAFASLAVCYVLVDIVNVWSGDPFRAAGRNSIIIFVGQMVMTQRFDVRFYVGPPNEHFVQLVHSGLMVALWLVVARIMERKKCFVSV